MISPSTRFATIKANNRKTLETAIREKKIDPLMVKISQFIAGTENYYTTSTCSGRITLMDLHPDEGKKENAFFRKWHRQVKLNEVWEGIQDDSNEGNVWFKQDALVFLIGTNSFEHAKHVMNICREAGIKRCGVNHFEDGNMHVELFGSHSMSVPVKINDNILVEKEYVKKLVEIANRKWKLNDERLKKFEKLLRKKLEPKN